jgi:hypothetical protein
MSSLLYQDFQLSEYGIFNATCDLPMSFRDRHRFLDGIYNSYLNPDLITAKEIGDVAQKVGLLMEEVLLWFEDEKLRRAELLANCQRQAQKSAYQFPSSPESARAGGEISSASSTYNATSPGTPSQSLDIFLPSVASVEQKILAPPTSKRGRPAKTHVKTKPDLSSPEAKRKKISVKYPCPDCRNFVAVERWAEHIDRKHFPENVWECPKTNRRTGKPCSSTPHYRPSYRHDNFATHLKGEHDCPASEVVELKRTCKFEVTDFFHKVCGFCEKPLGTRDESLEHVKEHLREFSQQPNPPADLGVSLWKENCGSEHKLQLGVHYRRSQPSNPDPMDKGHDHDHDEDENGESGDGNSDNPGHDSSDVQPNNNSHDQDSYEEGGSGEGSSENQDHDSSHIQPNKNSNDLPTWESAQPVPNLYTQPFPPGYTASPSLLQLPKNERQMPEYNGDKGWKCPRPNDSSPDAVNPSFIDRVAWVEADRARKLPYLDSQFSQYPPPRRAYLGFYNIQDGFSSEEPKEKGRCSYPECGKVFKDLKAHMLTHQNERPEKCPIKTCDYHIKGFSRKYDMNRHTLTHYKDTMVCGFCPGSGSITEKSFNRADVFKRHLTSVHAVEQTHPNKRQKTLRINSHERLFGYPTGATGKCSTCTMTFSNAQDFYEHLDDCVLGIVHQQEPLEAINAARPAGVEQDQAVHKTLRSNAFPTETTNTYSADEDEDDKNDDDFTLRSKSSHNGRNKCNAANGVQKSRGLTHSKGGVTLNTKGHKKCKDYPSSWGRPNSQIKMKKRIIPVFDRPRCLWKDDMMLDTDCDVRLKLSDGKAYVTDLDIQTMREGDAFKATEGENGLWIADDLAGMDLEILMEVKRC